MDFYIGQKVICVDLKGLREFLDRPNLLELNSIYTIIGFGHNPLPDTLGRRGSQFVHLLEVVRPYGNPYGVYRFRPLTSRSTDISLFTAMLGPKQKETIDG